MITYSHKKYSRIIVFNWAFLCGSYEYIPLQRKKIQMFGNHLKWNAQDVCLKSDNRMNALYTFTIVVKVEFDKWHNFIMHRTWCLINSLPPCEMNCEYRFKYILKQILIVNRYTLYYFNIFEINIMFIETLSITFYRRRTQAL